MRSLFFEENEDDTITVTINFGIPDLGEQTFVLPFSFDQLEALVPADMAAASLDLITKNMVHIPNTANEDGL